MQQPQSQGQAQQASVLVSNLQRGNPILKCLRQVRAGPTALTASSQQCLPLGALPRCRAATPRADSCGP